MNSTVLNNRKNYVVLGNTENSEKYAYRIKRALLDLGMNVFSSPSDGKIDDAPFDIDLLDFCINPVRGLEMLKECSKKIGFAVLQPGASSDDIKAELERRGIKYIDGCILKEIEKG